MVHSIEFSGRIGRTDGKLVAAGRFDLSFRLHADRDSTVALWEEEHDGVSVGTGGAFHVVLGEANGLSASLFATSPRWLSIWVRRGDSVMEAAERVALTGLQLRLAEEVARIREQVEASPVAQLPGTSNVDVEARRRLVRVHRRVRRIEGGGGILHGLLGRVAALETRLGRLDDDERGRVVRLEDEIDDIVGPQGDILDLLERVEALEGGGVAAGVLRSAPQPGADPGMGRRTQAMERQIESLSGQVDTMRKLVDVLVARLAKPAAGAAESLAGPVTVQKGGVHVASGGLLVHDIEGRVPGASKREGALHINTRAGGDVFVGNKDSGGIVATGALRGGRAPSHTRTVSVRMSGPEGIGPGEVVALDTRKKAPTVARAKAGDVPLGVTVAHAAVELGDGAVLIAVAGIAKARVRGTVAAGDVLVVGDLGLAAAGAPGTMPTLGRALTGSSGDMGEVEVLLFAP